MGFRDGGPLLSEFVVNGLNAAHGVGTGECPEQGFDVMACCFFIDADTQNAGALAAQVYSRFQSPLINPVCFRGIKIISQCVKPVATAIPVSQFLETTRQQAAQTMDSAGNFLQSPTDFPKQPFK